MRNRERAHGIPQRSTKARRRREQGLLSVAFLSLAVGCGGTGGLLPSSLTPRQGSMVDQAVQTAKRSAIEGAVRETFGEPVAGEILKADFNGINRRGPLPAVRFTVANVGRTQAEFGRAYLRAKNALGIKTADADERMEALNALHESPLGAVLDSDSSEQYDEDTQLIIDKLERVQAGQFRLSESAKAELGEAQKSWVRGGKYHTYAALGMRALSESLDENGLRTATNQLASSRGSAITMAELSELPVSMPRWLLNTKDVVVLLNRMNEISDVSGVNEAELELAADEAQDGVDEIAAREGVAAPASL